MMGSLQGENLFYPVPGSICKTKMLLLQHFAETFLTHESSQPLLPDIIIAQLATQLPAGYCDNISQVEAN
jgi:hypothetical protein